ncbi:TIGR03435 family protein [Terriglobus sp. RCC_193]|uniref:TIGR03435 family protein n=1 Tax=Terriglobus sp. RCC_193 TaxID=3239218 RepID=UPI003523ED09
MRPAILAFTLAVTTTALAQTPLTAPPDARFEVATIKPGTPGENSGIRFLASFTQVFTQNTSVTDLLKYAYGLHGDQIISGPEDLMHRGYAINAVVSADTPTKPNADLLKQMLRNLLADRFGLTFHPDTRELPVYVLTADTPHLKPTEQTMPMTTGGYDKGHLFVGNGALRELAAYLQRFVTNRPVLDRTGITGHFDMDIHFTPDDAAADTSATATEYPGLFTAIRQQLGLKLTATKAPAPVIIIDKITDPTAN